MSAPLYWTLTALLVVVLLLIGLWAYQTATRLNRLHVRYDLSWQALDGALGRLIALAESYPDLKANQTMMQLSEELTSTENRVAFSRQAYNDAVMNYNNRRETFPGNIFAGMFGFTQAALLEIPPDRPEMRDAPRVQF